MPKLGYKQTIKHKEKIKKNHAKPWLGKKRHPFSDNTKQKMSNTAKNQHRIPPSRKGIKATEQTRKKMRENHLGNKCIFWKGGINPINKSIRNSLEYRLWREAVFARDNYTCIWCGNRSGNGKKVIINADHIKPFALFPELRFAIDNGRTLCYECHKTTNTFAGRAKDQNGTYENKTLQVSL